MSLVSFWIPTEPVDEATSLEIIPGTHLGQWFLPRTFKTGLAKWFPEGCLPECPPYDERRDILRWALQPGDCVAFHFLAVHGAPGVASTAPRRPVYSLRLIGSDVTFTPRSWITSPDLSHSNDTRRPGVLLSGPLFPTLYTCPIDLQAYSLVGPTSMMAGLVGRLRALYLECGAVVLPGFLTPHALKVMRDEVQSAVGSAYVSSERHNVYFDPGLPYNHPRNISMHTVVGNIVYDLLPAHSLLRHLYAYEPLLELVRGVLGLSTLHRHNDSCTVHVFKPGEKQDFCYDETMVYVTLMLTEAYEGGIFEYFPNLKSECGGKKDVEAEHTAVGLALDRLSLIPGAIAIFNGHTVLHSVGMVKDFTTRIVAVFAYNEKEA